MKNVTKKQKIIIAIIALVIIIGTIITATIGLNFDLRFQDAKKVELYLGKDFESSDIKEIAKETIPDQSVIIQKVEVFEDSVRIIAKEITEEQKQNLIDKVNEKYQTELKADTTEITTIPHTRGRDIVKPYIVPFAIATIIILVYMALRYKKIGTVKVLLKTIIISVVAQALLLSIIAITRIPVGRLTMPMVMLVYLLTFIGMTTKLEKELESKKENEKKTK